MAIAVVAALQHPGTSGQEGFRDAVVAEFDDLDAFNRYAADHKHLDVIERLLKPILSTRHAVQLEG